MPTILPSDWRSLDATGAQARELETLAQLAHGLPDALTVFHGVHWSRVERGFPSLGEIDFVVLGPSARVLLIEQKSGLLDETEEGLVKRYPGRSRSVRLQIDRTLSSLWQRLTPLAGGEPLHLEYLFYCPDYRVRDPGSAGLDPARIVDAPQRATLCARITQIFRDEPPNPELARKLHRFFANELQLAADAGALIGRAADLVTRLSGGLATWARRIEARPPRMRVIGSAGSGKTQLALALLNDAADAGRRALYLCFNRPLADHLRQAAPPQVEVLTFHQWCERRLRRHGESIDFSEPGAFERLERRALALAGRDDDPIELLIVDEGQDFTAAWRDALLAGLSADAAVWWLEDPMQNLYARAALAFDGWTVLRAPENHRSPRRIVHAVNHWCLADSRMEAAGPFDGEDVELLTYADARGLLEATKRALTQALQAGFRRQDIMLLTFAGRERSALLPFDALGPHRIKAFSGRYDLLGMPEYSDGDLLMETVYRFKGQSAPCVVFTEIDFAELDQAARRKLFVGMTRASMRLFMVLSERSAAALPAMGLAE